MSGGGSTGDVGFPGYIETWHENSLGASDPSTVTGFTTLDNAMANASTNNPFTGATAAGTAHVEAVVDDWDTDVQSVINNLDDQTDWQDRIDTAVSKIITGDLLDDLDPHTNLAGDAESGADTNITKAKNSIDTGVNEISDWETFIDAVESKLDAKLDDANVDLSAIESTVRSASDNEISDALTAALDQVGVTPNSDWAAKVDEAISKVDNASVLEDINMASAVSAAKSDADSVVDAAITKAESLVKSSLIDPVVNEFEQKAQSRLNERKRSVSSFYADANAVHSSGFLISQALLERNKQREVNQFDAETRLDLFSEAFQGHLQTFQANLQTRAQEEVQESQQRLEFITQGAQAMAQILSQKVQFEESVAQLHAQSYGQRMQQENQNRTETATLNKQSRDQLIGQQTNTIAEIFANKMQYEQTFMQLHLQAFQSRLENYLRAEARNKQSDDKMVQQGTSGMLQASRTDAELTINERRAFAQAAVSDFEVRQTAEEYEINLDQKDALWELKVQETGANVLAAPSGMAARVPPQKSDTSKALGGALAGAATGAAVGSAFGPPGTAIGAGVGAIVGGVSGFV